MSGLFSLDQDQIIATLRELYNDHVLSAHDLARIRNGENPLRAQGGINAHTFSGVIDAVIGQLKQNPEADTKLEELIRELEIERGDQRIQVVETKQELLPMTMHTIRRGEFWMGSPEDEIGRIISELSRATPVPLAKNEVGEGKSGGET